MLFVPKNKHLTVRIDYDQDAENPSEWGAWRLYSFLDIKSRDIFDDNDCFLPQIEEKLKNKLAFIVSLYEHSGCQWSLQGEGYQCQWDTTNGAGIVVWNDEEWYPEEDKRELSARDFLEIYNDWTNGACYGFSIENEDEEVVDSCWGFIGEDDVLSAIRENLPDVYESITVTGDAAWVGKGEL